MNSHIYANVRSLQISTYTRVNQCLANKRRSFSPPLEYHCY